MWISDLRKCLKLGISGVRNVGKANSSMTLKQDTICVLGKWTKVWRDVLLKRGWRLLGRGKSVRRKGRSRVQRQVDASVNCATLKEVSRDLRDAWFTERVWKFSSTKQAHSEAETCKGYVAGRLSNNLGLTDDSSTLLRSHKWACVPQRTLWGKWAEGLHVWIKRERQQAVLKC